MRINRREFIAASGALAAGCAAEPKPAAPPAKREGRFPALFVSHGSPRVALIEDDYAFALRAFAAANFAPAAIVVVSAHWEEEQPVRVGSSERPKTIHDFSGFEKELYEIAYGCPGSPALAREIVDRLNDAGAPARLEDRGLDHGAWVPLSIAYPSATFPVLQVALSTPSPAELARIGRALAPLRDRGVLLIGSGGMTHNLRRPGRGRTEPWAAAFDDWIRARLETLDIDALHAWKRAAPEPETAHPTTEHFDPLFFVLGAAAAGERVEPVYEGFRGNLSMRSFAIL